jgi:hypothetical protein
MKFVIRKPDRAYVDNWLWVPKAGLNVEGVKNALQFKFIDNHDERKVRTVYLWKETDQHLLVPREFWKPEDLPVPVVDCRPSSYPHAKIKSRIRLDHLPDERGKLKATGLDVQRRSLQVLIDSPGGILQLSCGKGKTVVFLELAARMNAPVLMIVPDTHLMEQWEKQAKTLLDIPGGIGFIQADKFDWKKQFVLATYHTIAARAEEMPEEIRRWFGLIGWDEGHHISAPTFTKSADIFYGKRVALTATPIRDDGTHIIYNFHIGPVVFKDLTQEVKPRIIFKWTGLRIDDPKKVDVTDKNGDIHLSKLATHFAQWRSRLELIINDIKDALAAGRQKILVLSNSIAEIVNLLALWTHGPNVNLYSDIPEPTPQELGETLAPEYMDPIKVAQAQATISALKAQLLSMHVNPVKVPDLKKMVDELEEKLERSYVWTKVEREIRKRQRTYIRELQKHLGNAGLMIHEVAPKIRADYIRKKQIVFAIMKYGKEGLDSPDLDTVIVCEPISQKNGLQQIMGRTTRNTPGKMKPVVVFYEDDIGPLIGMCKKLKSHLLSWPHDEGGPFDYELHGHPIARHKWKNQPATVFGA